MLRKIVFFSLLAALPSLSAAAQSPAAPVPPPAPPPTVVPTPVGGMVVTPPSPARLARLSPLGTAPDWKALQVFAKTITRVELESALRDLYTDGTPFPPPWTIEGGALRIQTGDPVTPEVSIELNPRAEPPSAGTRFWHRLSELPRLKDDAKPLADLHIALDPGHIGGNFATMEERHLSFQPNEGIQEGNLSLITANALAERLKELGAYVSLVRENHEPVTKQRPVDLQQAALKLLQESGFPTPVESYNGLTGDAKLLTVQWQSEKLFYRVSEIHARGQKVNQTIKPDLVICLHYNAEAWGAATSPQYSPKNHFHVLVNGCYSPLELEQADVRFEMFRRLFSRIHEEEIPLADALAGGLRVATGLPSYVYTTPNARRAGKDEAVYARNLLANRIYDCPVVYLEPYVMNHEETYRRLLAGHFLGRTLIAGRLQRSAVADYVRGVVDGLVTHYQKFRKPAQP